MNYYQIHKNKRSKLFKKLNRRRKPNMFALQCGLITASSFIQNSIIASQPFKSVAEKSLIVAGNIINTAKAITNLSKSIKKDNYLKRIAK